MKLNSKRIIVYIVGCVLLALGLSLNIKSSLGTSAIISVATVLSNWLKLKIGDATFLWYSIIVFIEICIHVLNKRGIKVYVLDVLQLPFSVVFTRFINLFSNLIPFIENNLILQFLMLTIAIALTAVGASMMIHMELIANPGDGILSALSDIFNKDIGTVKNIVDFSCIGITLLLGFVTKTGYKGIGIGTICSMVLTGRFMKIYNLLADVRLNEIRGKE